MNESAQLAGKLESWRYTILIGRGFSAGCQLRIVFVFSMGKSGGCFYVLEALLMRIKSSLVLQ